VYTLPGVDATTITPKAYLVPGTREYVLGNPPVVLNSRVAKVFALLKIVVEAAVLATSVASPVESLNVYRPNLISEVPDVSTLAEATLIEFTVEAHIGVKKVKYTLPLVSVALLFPVLGVTSTTERL
jgi:hypothetical protein